MFAATKMPSVPKKITYSHSQPQSPIIPTRMAIKYLSPLDIAERLGVSDETVYRLLRSGRISSTRISRKVWRILESDFDAFMRKK